MDILCTNTMPSISHLSTNFPGHSFQVLFLDKEGSVIYFRHILPPHWAKEAKRDFLEYALDLKKEGYSHDLNNITESEISELLFNFCVVHVAPVQDCFTVCNRTYTNLTDLIENEFDTTIPSISFIESNPTPFAA